MTSSVRETASVAFLTPTRPWVFSLRFRAHSDRVDGVTMPRAGNAMWQLNLAMSEEEAIQIVDLYDTTGKGEMRYEQLVKDVCAGVPHFTKQYDDPETIQKLRKLDRAEPTTRGKAHDDERMM